MKKQLRDILAFCLCLCICANLALPAFAVNNLGITYTASLDQSTVTVSESVQTVVMTVVSDQPMDTVGIGGTVFAEKSDGTAAPFTIVSIINTDSRIVFDKNSMDTDTGEIAWTQEELLLVEDVTSIAVVEFSIPAGTSTGVYKLGIKDLILNDENFDEWEDGATVATNLTITVEEPSAPPPVDPPTEADNYDIWYTLDKTADTETTPDGYKELEIGDTVTATVHLKNNTDATILQAYDVYLTHSEHLTPSAAAEGSVFKLFTGDADTTDGVKEAHIQFAADEAHQQALASGATVVLGTITFTVADTAIYGEGVDITLVEGPKDGDEKTTNIAIGSTVGDKKSYYPDVINTVTEKNAENEDVEVTYNGVEITDTYTVKYDANGGTGAPANETKGHNVAHTLSTTEPTWEGHEFVGWALSSTATETDCITTLDADVNREPITVYAVWDTNSYPITFNANGGDGTMEDQSFTFNVPQKLSANEFTKTGYKFTGWNTQADGSGTSYGDEAEVSFASATTLYAQWQIEKFTITFADTGITTVDPITQDYGTAIAAPTVTPEKEGYTFDGWENLPETMPAKNVTVTAKWKVNQYTITFAETGKTTIDSITQDYGSAVTAPTETPEKDGYTFDGWENLPETMPAENVTVTAKWKVNQYTITFVLEDGEFSNEIKATLNAEGKLEYDITSTKTLPEPEYEGYTFGGWLVTSDAKGSWTSADPYAADTSVTGKWGTVEMTAIWTANPYNVDAEKNITGCDELSATNSDGQSGTTAEVGDTINVTADPADGYQVKSVGYYMTADKDDPNKVVTPILNNSFQMPAGDVTVTAEFEGIEYTINFNANEGTGSADPVAVKYGEEAILPTTGFTRDGYEFNGWNTQSDGSGTNYAIVDGKITATKVMVPTQDNKEVTLYAVWEAVPYTVTVDDNIENGTVAVKDATAETKFTVGQTVTLDITPATGYKVATVSYTKDNETTATPVDAQNGVYSFTMPAANVTVTATFVKEDYDVTVAVSQNGTVESDKAKAQMGDIVTMTITSAAGYELDQLVVKYTDGQTTVAVVDNKTFTMPAADVTVTATFKLKELKVTVSEDIDETKGEVTTDQQDGTAKMGDEVTLTITPEHGYELDELTVTYEDADGNEKPVTVDDNDKFIMPEADVTIKATFKVISYEITFDLQGGEFSNEIKAMLNENGKLVYDIEDDTVLPVPSKPNHTFNGWTLENTTEGWPDGEYTKDTTVKGKWGSVPLKAKWTATVSLKIEDYRYSNEVGYKLLRVADNLDANTVYLFNGQPMYYTTHSTYLVNTGDTGAFYILVEDQYITNGTLNDAGNKLLTTGSGTRTRLEYDGDINDDGVLNIADANVVYQMIVNQSAYYDISVVDLIARLLADMDASATESTDDHRGSIADVNAIVNKINGQNVTSAPNP